MHLDFASGRVRLDVRDGLLFVHLAASLASAGEVALFRIAVEREGAAAKADRALVELAGPTDWLTTAGGPAWWSWLASRRVFVRAAVVVDDPDFVERFRRPLVECGSRVSVHRDVALARAWLLGGTSMRPPGPEPSASVRPKAIVSEPEIVIQRAEDE